MRILFAFVQSRAIFEMTMGSVALHGQPVREFSSHSIGDSSNIWVIWLFVGHQGQLGLGLTNAAATRCR